MALSDITAVSQDTPRLTGRRVCCGSSGAPTVLCEPLINQGQLVTLTVRRASGAIKALLGHK